MKGILPIFLVIAIASAATIQRNRRDTGQTPKETTDFENFVATIQSAGEEFKNTFQKVATQVGFNFVNVFQIRNIFFLYTLIFL